MRTHLVTTLALLCSSLPAFAGDLRVEARGGAASTIDSVRLWGDPGLHYLLYVQLDDAGLVLPELIKPFVTPARVGDTRLQFQGVLDAGGQARIDFLSSPEMAGVHLSFIGRQTPGTYSNHCRHTYLAPRSFGQASSTALGVSFLGDLFPLPDGRMLAIGGAGPVVSAYDTVAEELLPIGLLPSAFVLATRAQLADGRVLVCGGLDNQGIPSAEAYLFDPATGQAASVGPMGAARAAACSVRLPSGKVLIVGGLSTIDITNPTTFFDGILNTSELFDPATSSFAGGPSIPEKKAVATATLLNNAQVLVAGGLGVIPFVNLPFVSNTAYTYNSGSNTFNLFPKTFTAGRLFHNATKMSDGRVLISGGVTADLTGILTTGDPTQIAFSALDGTALYSTTGLGSFSNGPTLAATRALHTSTALLDGSVLVAGGFTGTLDIGAILSGNPALPTPLASSELVNAAGTVAGPTLVNPRTGASALRNPGDGRVVIVGGGPLAVELYQP